MTKIKKTCTVSQFFLLVQNNAMHFLPSPMLITCLLYICIDTHIVLLIQTDSRGFSYNSWSNHPTLSIKSGRLHMFCCFIQLEKEMEMKKGTSSSSSSLLADCLTSLVHAHPTGTLSLPSWASSRKELICPFCHFNIFITELRF